MKIRASRLPLAMVCPASVQPNDYDLNSDSEPARLGTAVHEWLSTRISSPERLEVLGDESFEQLAVKYSLEVDDIRSLSLRAIRLWREVAEWFPSPRLEVALSKDLGGLQMTGHVDVLSYSEETQTIHVNDHKTGFLDADHSDQVRAYALMALDLFPKADRVHTCITKVRDFCHDDFTYTRLELTAWAERVAHRLVNEGNTYQPGRHCSFCPRRYTCQVFKDWIVWAMSILSGAEVLDLETAATPANVQAVYDSKSAMNKHIEEATDALRTLVSGNGGSLDCGDGMQLQITAQIRQNVQFREAWPILSDRIPEHLWNSVFAVKKTALQDAIKSMAGRGDKKHAVSGLMAELEGAGALAETTIERMELRKKPLAEIAS